MIPITRREKTYFAAVGILALWVGLWGYFIPGLVNWAIPWLVPPLHARFLGSMYLSGATFMVGCLLARRYAEVRVVVPMIAIWTGMLFIVSLFYLDQFDYTITPTYIWFAAYIIYPLIAVWLAWKHRLDREPLPGAALPGWVQAYLLAQGAVDILLGLALLFFPQGMIAFWPWKITRLLAHLYSAPFLSYGIGGLMLARQKTWAEIAIAVRAMFIFCAGVLLASLIHRGLFSPANPYAWIWFGGFLISSFFLGVLSGQAGLVARAQKTAAHQTMETAA